MASDRRESPDVLGRVAFLLDRTEAPAVFLCGAGLSWGTVPLPDQLYGDRERIERELNCGPFAQDNRAPGPFYRWADQVLRTLAAQVHPERPKLRLCKALGVLTDPRWFGRVDVPLRGTTDRHRVIARFAREGRWHELWSLNWDCLLENALQEVGLDRDGQAPPHPWPWRTAYSTHVIGADLALTCLPHIVALRKPHGCVHAMREADELSGGDVDRAAALIGQFKIGATELTTDAAETRDDQAFVDTFRSQLREHPLVVVGWSASEPRLQQAISAAVKPLAYKPRVGIIDLALNGAGHAHLTAAYGVEPQSAHWPVLSDQCPTCPTTDQLFLWLQTCYALRCLREHASPALSNTLDDWERSIASPCDLSFLIPFTDVFLPAWTRMCWRAGLVRCRGFAPQAFDLSRAEVHVPWEVPNIERPDLAAAAHLLALLPSAGAEWNPSRFPGALWRDDDLRLVLPLPAWGEPADLSGLAPLLRAIGEQKGYIREFAVLPLRHDDRPVQPDVEARLIAATAGLIRVPGLAVAERIHIQRQL